ncbi:ion transporter [Xanthomonas sp. NCPPB 2654]|uniref:ion transporter n=1 Tax=unclassified Xanthomonas TaxID=2643310 RepID=UPI0021E0ED64|nr:MULTISPECIES: ion transporter [unclassified Xanthomonas]MDL5365742.1 ion transporter [Xanthomonas sp. NCPPB 2654]UYC19871.1 ion transporter [Xanthomonas sp. CFBP 8443]
MRLFTDPQLAPASEHGWRRRWFDIIYRHDTRPSRNFDLLLVAAIVASVAVIMADSVPALHARYARPMYVLEWGFTALFTAEYVLRLATVKRPLRYALSFWGVIDLLSTLPTYVSFLLPGAQTLLVVRVLRVLRLFRILKLTRYVEESSLLVDALWRSRRKVFVFLFAVITLVVIFGALMYVVEGPANGFTSIPTAMYWAVVTMATVGFGDIAPLTPLGRAITSVLILIGYSIIAVPTGIYTAELANSLRDADRDRAPDQRSCARCGLQGHDRSAGYCRNCGQPLPDAAA